MDVKMHDFQILNGKSTPIIEDTKFMCFSRKVLEETTCILDQGEEIITHIAAYM